MKARRVMVAGGAGFVGSALVRHLASLGADIIVIDNFQTGSRQNLEGLKGVEVLCCDVLDDWSVAQAFRTARPEFLFNLVGETFIPTSYAAPKRFLRTNALGHINLMLASQQHEVERIVYASTAEVYGNPATVPIDESFPLDAANTYAVTKLTADRLCATFHAEHGIPVIAARLFNCYGPRETEPYLIPEIIDQLHRGDSLQLGSLEAVRDYTYVTDTARALAAVMTSTLPNGSAVNIGSNHGHSVAEVARLIGSVMGKPDVDIQVDPRRLRSNEILQLRADSSLLRENTGWSPQVALEEGLRRTVQWFWDHGSRWPWQDRTVFDRHS